MQDILSLASANLLTPMILCFALGLFAALARSELTIPEAVAKGMSIYLLFAIGFKGGVAVAELRVDGGACVNNLLMQFQADLLGIPVVRPAITETTALGAAYLAGLSCGVFKDLNELSAQWQVEHRFEPSRPPSHAAELMARWEHAVRQTVL